MKRAGIVPAPLRRKHTTWRTFLKHYKQQMLACDFFVVETVRLKTLYVLFFIEMGSRRVQLAGCTQHPDSAWVAQQARQVSWDLSNHFPLTRFLIRDNDKKHTAGFDAIFQSTGIEVIQTPFQAPNANAYAERFVRTVREECLDRIIILNQTRLAYALRAVFQ